MKKLLWFIISVVSLGSLYMSYNKPELMISPGKLSKSHSNKKISCSSCHTTGNNNFYETCIKCHKLNQIGNQTVDRKLITSKVEGLKPFHSFIPKTSCSDCHKAHDSSIKLQSIKTKVLNLHSTLRPEELANCIQCHVNSNKNFHVNLKQNCISCHNISTWKFVKFEHSSLEENISQKCITCHKKPKDSYHQESRESCLQCHLTKSWLPSTLKHDMYFKFDRHHRRTNCSNCHQVKNDYKQYSCQKCHSTKTTNIIEKHKRKKIRFSNNCVRCHRSKSNTEAKNKWKSINSKEGNK